MGYNSDLAKKALVILSIEKALLDIDKDIYNQVRIELYQKYHSYFQDCYEHPEYLSEIFKKLYGNAGKVVVASIRKQLEEFSSDQPIARFLEVISK